MTRKFTKKRRNYPKMILKIKKKLWTMNWVLKK